MKGKLHISPAINRWANIKCPSGAETDAHATLPLGSNCEPQKNEVRTHHYRDGHDAQPAPAAGFSPLFSLPSLFGKRFRYSNIE
ncbi:MAG TPA: hypothetical protein VIH42_07230 [Thermoguttaceae bacterium]